MLSVKEDICPIHCLLAFDETKCSIKGLFVCLFVCLFVGVFVCLFVCLFVVGFFLELLHAYQQIRLLFVQVFSYLDITHGTWV